MWNNFKMKYKINNQKCTGCRLCVSKCPGTTKIGADGKAIIINQEKLEQCGGESVCPFGAIERVDGKKEIEQESKIEERTNVNQRVGMGRGQGFGQGGGIGAGRGRGMGLGPRDGRGMGRGGGGRRR